jgi:hypothetical protein
MERGLVHGMALAWCDVQTGDRRYWQGGGRLERKRGYPNDTPRIVLVGLIDEGWQAADIQGYHDKTSVEIVDSAASYKAISL